MLSQIISEASTSQIGGYFNLCANKLSIAGNIASVAGFCLSIYVVRTARNINKYVLFNIRLPQLNKEIRAHASSINSLIGTFDDSVDDLCDELSKCEANLKALRKKVPRAQKKTIASLITLISSNASNTKLTKEVARDIYRQLLHVIEDVKNLLKDYQVEQKYGN